MSGLELMKKYKLPQNIKVAVKVTSEGIFFASFPDYPGCITEAKDILDLISNITDVILTYFDVPRKEAMQEIANYWNNVRTCKNLDAGEKAARMRYAQDLMVTDAIL